VKYALLIYAPDRSVMYAGLSEAEQQDVYAEYTAINDEPGTVAGAGLQGTETATTVRVQNGSVLTTDGPFVETKEALGGFYLVEADDLDGALEVAGRIPAARFGGAVEVRPLMMT
jgi:hypothetical protein